MGEALKFVNEKEQSTPIWITEWLEWNYKAK